jgi:hypothetical protein
MRNDLSAPIIRAGSANLLAIPLVALCVYLNVNAEALVLYGIPAWVYSSIVLIVAVWHYDHLTNRIDVKADSLVFMCPFRVIEIPRNRITKIRVRCPLALNWGDIHVSVKCSGEWLSRRYHMNTFFIPYSDLKERVAIIRDILERGEGHKSSAAA